MPRGGPGGVVGDSENRLNSLPPPPQDDQYGRGGSRERYEPTRHFSASEEDQFGRQRPPQQHSTSSRGGFGGRGFPASNLDRRGSGVGSGGPPGNRNLLQMSGGMENSSNQDAEDERGFYHQHQKQPQQHQYSGVSPKESGFSGTTTQRFEGPPYSSMNRSQPPLPRPNVFPVSLPASSHTTATFKQSVTGQTLANDSSASNNSHHEHHRSQTPTQGVGTGSVGGANHLNQGSIQSNELSANIVPESPTQPTREEDYVFSCPPSPPPAAPSAYALSLSRMIEMNEDMEFAHARLMMLEHEHEKIQARLKTLENLQLEEGNVV